MLCIQSKNLCTLEGWNLRNWQYETMVWCSLLKSDTKYAGQWGVQLIKNVKWGIKMGSKDQLKTNIIELIDDFI